jgi:hypothetical protein
MSTPWLALERVPREVKLAIWDYGAGMDFDNTQTTWDDIYCWLWSGSRGCQWAVVAEAMPYRKKLDRKIGQGPRWLEGSVQLMETSAGGKALLTRHG